MDKNEFELASVIAHLKTASNCMGEAMSYDYRGSDKDVTRIEISINTLIEKLERKLYIKQND